MFPIQVTRVNGVFFSIIMASAVTNFFVALVNALNFCTLTFALHNKWPCQIIVLCKQHYRMTIQEVTNDKSKASLKNTSNCQYGALPGVGRFNGMG